MENYGKRIKEFRIKSNLTQAELGKQLNVTSQAVSKWENDLSEPDLQSTIKMCEIFGISVNELLDVDKENSTEISDQENVASPLPVENDQLSDNKNANQQLVEQPKIISGYCSACKKPVYQGEYEVMTGRTGQTVYCKKCWDKIQEKQKQANYNELNSELIKGIIFGVIAGIIGFISTIVPSITQKYYAGIGFSIFVLISCFSLVSQLFWDGFMQEMFFFFCKSFRMPGIIFSLDWDGLKFLIFAKILFAILSVALSVGFFMLGLILCLPVSLVTFPFALTRQIKERNQYA